MKRFFTSILCATVFFIGLGTMIEKAGANFKSDAKALELLAKARQAIGGDAALNSVKSMTILGKTTKTIETENTARTEGGDVEINFELPDKLSKMVKLGSADGNQMIDKKVDVIVMRKGDGDNIQWKTEGGDNAKVDGVKRVIVKKNDGTEEVLTENIKPIIIRKSDGNADSATSENGKKIYITKDEKHIGGSEKLRTNELFRTTLSLLLSAPEGLDVSYTYIGEGSVDGISCDIITVNDGGSSIKLYLDKSTSLPRMMTFQSPKPFIVKFDKNAPKPDGNGETKFFTRELPQPELADFQVKFSDYRSVNGIQFPFKWTQTIGGKNDEITDITSYEINPANIADKFQNQKVLMRTRKEQ